MSDHAHGVEPSRTEAEATTGSNATTGAETATGTEVAREAEPADDGIEARLRAVERAVTGEEARPADVAAGAEATAERERLESRLDDLEARVAELESATQAIRGYAGAIRAVNREVERRADLALARATDPGRSGRSDGSDPGAGGEEAVPSESALDAALPGDRPAAEPRIDGDEDNEGGDRGAWAADALDRLRESL